MRMLTGEPSGITLFAAIHIDHDRPVSDLDRFLALAIPSLRARMPREVVDEIIVVVPPHDLHETTARLDGVAHVPLRVVDERSIVALDDGMAGWIKQQIVKLAAPGVVRTPWYITLDADVVATRTVDREFLLPGGRAIWEREPATAHWRWWEASAELLGCAPVDPEGAAFGVTPAVMHTRSVRELTDAIERAHPGRSWVETLRALHDTGWTEYTLYWTHLVASGRAADLYADVDRVPYALTGSVWTREDLVGGAAPDLDAVFAPDAPHAFFVFQSNLEEPLERTVERLRPHIEPGVGISQAERRHWARHARRHRWRGRARRALAAVRRLRRRH